MSVTGWVKNILGEGENDNLTLSQTTHFRQLQTEFADNNLKFDENGRMLSKWVKNTQWEKENLLVTSNLSFSHAVFKRLLMQTRKNLGLLGKGLSSLQAIYPFPTLFSKDL